MNDNDSRPRTRPTGDCNIDRKLAGSRADRWHTYSIARGAESLSRTGIPGSSDTYECQGVIRQPENVDVGSPTPIRSWLRQAASARLHFCCVGSTTPLVSYHSVVSSLLSLRGFETDQPLERRICQVGFAPNPQGLRRGVVAWQSSFRLRSSRRRIALREDPLYQSSHLLGHQFAVDGAVARGCADQPAFLRGDRINSGVITTTNSRVSPL